MFAKLGFRQVQSLVGVRLRNVVAVGYQMIRLGYVEVYGHLISYFVQAGVSLGVFVVSVPYLHA